MFTEDRGVSSTVNPSLVTTTRVSDVTDTTDASVRAFNSRSESSSHGVLRRIGVALCLFAALGMGLSGLIGNLLRMGSLPGFTLPVAVALATVVVVIAVITYFASDRKNRSRISILGSVFVSVIVTLSMVSFALFIWSVV